MRPRPSRRSAWPATGNPVGDSEVDLKTPAGGSTTRRNPTVDEAAAHHRRGLLIGLAAGLGSAAVFAGTAAAVWLLTR